MSPSIAKAFEEADIEKREKAEILVNIWLNNLFGTKSESEKLIEILDKGAAEAKANGLTSDILAQLLKHEQ